MSEVTDINERVAIMLAFKQLLEYIQAGTIVTPSGGVFTPATPLMVGFENAKAIISGYISSSHSNEKETNFENLVYNLRYRTFGPHHLVHIIDYIVFSLVNCKHNDICSTCASPP
jgi:hypothetical protein